MLSSRQPYYMRGSIYPREETIIEELKGHRSFRFEPCALSFQSKEGNVEKIWAIIQPRLPTQTLSK